MNGTRHRGFTLIELLITLVIMVTIVAVAVPKFSRAMTYVELRKSTQQIAASLRKVRNDSLVESRVTELIVASDTQSLRSPDDAIVYQWPDDIIVEMANRAPYFDDADPVLKFFPDGSATDSMLTVTALERSYTITVDWLTGRVQVL